MGNSAKEVQSKMPMDIIAFADDARKQMECRGKRPYACTVGVSEIASTGAEMVQQIRCCIATVQADGLPFDHQFVNPLFQITVRVLRGPGMPLASAAALMSPG